MLRSSSCSLTHCSALDPVGPSASRHAFGQDPMAASAIFILDARGKSLISRVFRNDLPPDAMSQFRKRVINSEDVSATISFPSEKLMDVLARV